jgi:hypothetical protein
LWLQALARKNSALAKFGKFLEIFGGCFECFEWLGPNRNYFLETEGPAAILPTSRDRGLTYNKLMGFYVKFTRFNEFRLFLKGYPIKLNLSRSQSMITKSQRGTK